MNDDRFYLVHIIECITDIEQFTLNGKDEFLSDKKTQAAVLRTLQIMAGFRNALVHDYFGVNLVRVWEIIEKNLPELKRNIEAILKEL